MGRQKAASENWWNRNNVEDEPDYAGAGANGNSPYSYPFSLLKMHALPDSSIDN